MMTGEVAYAVSMLAGMLAFGIFVGALLVAILQAWRRW